MELMSTCLEKLLKRVRQPIPERILGKVAVAVSMSCSFYSHSDFCNINYKK